MNHYQQGYLAGLTNEVAAQNPLFNMHKEFNAGVQAKIEGQQFNEDTWPELSLTFREGYKSQDFAHLKSKGEILKTGYTNWKNGHLSGLNKLNHVLAKDVHSVSFEVNVAVTAKSTIQYDPFIQHYTFLDYENEVYRIEARHRHCLTSEYPNQDIINIYPCLPGGVTLKDIEDELGREVLIGTHNILQSASAGYQPITLQNINFFGKSFSVYDKLLLDIPQWNLEAQERVDWPLPIRTFK